MKPTKMRNKMIYRADANTRSKQLSGMLSKDLRAKYGKRSARIIPGDSVRVVRGEFNNVDGKIKKVSVAQSRVSIEGVKREKSKGEKIDVMIHASNIVITSLHDEKWRMARITAKSRGGAEPSGAAVGQDEPREDAAESNLTTDDHAVADMPDVSSEDAAGHAKDTVGTEGTADPKIQEDASGVRDGGEPKPDESFANVGQDDPGAEPEYAGQGKDSKDDKPEVER